MRGFDQVARNVLHGRIDRKEGERGIDVGKRKYHSERAVQQELQWMLSQVQVLQRGIKHTVGPEDSFPGVGADKIADPEWDDQKLVEQVLFCASVKAQQVRDRVSQAKRENHDAGGDPGGAQKRLTIDVVSE